jgi:hypothetical protein
MESATPGGGTGTAEPFITPVGDVRSVGNSRLAVVRAEIRNPKHDLLSRRSRTIRNKSKIQRRKHKTERASSRFGHFPFSDMFRISSFGFRRSGPFGFHSDHRRRPESSPRMGRTRSAAVVAAAAADGGASGRVVKNRFFTSA